MLVNWAKKRPYLLPVLPMVAIAAIAGDYYISSRTHHAASSGQETPKLIRTCYYARMQFVSSDGTGAELEIEETQVECPEEGQG